MTQLEQRLILATGLVLLVGSGLYVALGGLSKPVPITASAPSAQPPSTDPTTGRPLIATGPIIPGPTDPVGDGVLRPGGAGLSPGLREPTGEDLSDPKVVRALLRAHLAEANPRWDYIAKLLQVYREPLDPDVKAALLAALEHGNAAGALQAFEVLNDGTVVPDLLRLLDDPIIDAHDRRSILEALWKIPGANSSEVVTGIESRLTGDLAHDRVYLAAIARTSSLEAVRALYDAISKAKAPTEIDADIWRGFDLKKSVEASDRLASYLRSTSLSPEALGVLVELAGQPGASRALIDALKALDADATPEPVRRRVLASLAASSDDDAIDRVLAVATKGADYASVAAKAVGEIRSASPATRAKLLELAKTTLDENLRAQTFHALGSLRVETAVPMLTDALTSPAPPIRTQAVIALGRIGTASEAATDALVKTYDAGDEALRQHVAIAIGKIGGSRAAGCLKQFLVVEKSEKVRTSIAGALRALGPP